MKITDIFAADPSGPILRIRSFNEIETEVDQNDVWVGVSHHFGKRISIGYPAIKSSEIALDSYNFPDDLSAIEKIGVKVFQFLQSKEYHEKSNNELINKEEPPTTGVHNYVSDTRDSYISTRRFTGKIIVGFVFVSGTLEVLRITESDQLFAIGQSMEGLSWLGNTLGSPVKLNYDCISTTVDVENIDNPPNERFWSDPAMAKLGYQSVTDYVRKIKDNNKSDWAFASLITNYNLYFTNQIRRERVPAYAYMEWDNSGGKGGPFMVINYRSVKNDHVGFKLTFAHETGHIFGAPDEYLNGCENGCDKAYGIYKQENQNCERCVGHVRCIMAYNSEVICEYTPWHLGCPPMTRLYKDTYIGQVSNARKWLIGDIDNDGKDEIIQLWGHLGLSVVLYKWKDNALKIFYEKLDIDPTSEALNWLLCDVNGDGRKEVVRSYLNKKGRLGIAVYGWQNENFVVRSKHDDVDEGDGALCWLSGNFKGNKSHDVVQLWKNGNSLGIIIYSWSKDFVLNKWWKDTWGEAPDAIEWLVGDVNGDGSDKIAQLRIVDNIFAIIIYGWKNNQMEAIYFASFQTQNYTIAKWLIGDINGDGKDEIIHIKKTGPNALGMTIYGLENNIFKILWEDNQMGPFNDTINWTIGDIDGDGMLEIVQQWQTGTDLGMTIYHWIDKSENFNIKSMNIMWTGKLKEDGSPAVNWLIGDLEGNRNMRIIQEWANVWNWGRLGTTIYGVKKPKKSSQ